MVQSIAQKFKIPSSCKFVGISLQNTNCVCCKYPSPIKIHALMPLLDIYPKLSDAVLLRDGFINGFRLGYKGKRHGRESPNLKSVSQNPLRAIEKLTKEIDKKRIAGPFAVSPIPDLIISPIGIIPKKEPGKFRLIQHLSYPDGDSINDGIDPNYCTVTYASFDVAIQLLCSHWK